MNRTIFLPLLAAAALAGCDNSGQTIVDNGPADPMANQLANAAPVELPPAIAASKSYRCGSDVVKIDWLEKDGKPAGANVTVGEKGSVVVLQPGADGNPPYTAADGTQLTGTKDAGTASLTLPGKGALSCKS